MPTCLVCGKELVKRDHESSARFNRKKFCSLVCTRLYMKENKCGWWNRNPRPYVDFVTHEEEFYCEEVMCSEGDSSYE